MSNLRVRAIISYGNRLVLIERIKQTGEEKKYFVFPGGGVEDFETLEECVHREVLEEVGIEVKPLRELYRVNTERKTEVFFLCEYISGEIGTGKGPEFTSKSYGDRGTYVPTTISLSEIGVIDLLPLVQAALIEDLKKYGSFENILFRELS